MQFKPILPALLVLLITACGSNPRTTDFKVVVLGFDGVDPDLVTEWLDQLPNIRELAKTGTLSRLGTTNPPESPVAWASFATGMNPGKHGIFDFLSRDPETYFPDISLVKEEKAEFLFGLIPIRGPQFTNNRRGLTFWKHLDDHGIASSNLRLPLEFPAQDLQHGCTLAGLGVPDVRGTWGTYFYLATDLTQWDLQDTEFGGRQVRLESDGHRIQAELDGPADPRSEGLERITIPIELELNDQSTAVTIRVQDQEQTLQEREWSDWFHFRFSVGPLAQSINGISRFYVLETFPEVQLYLLPISLNPADPPFAISEPDGYSAALVERQGLFKTVGWVHETWGLNEEQIEESVFLEDLFRNMDALETALLGELQEGKASLYTAVFTATDSVSHMFYRLLDPQHPRFEPQLADQFGDAILRVYQRMDSIIGNVLTLLNEDDILLIVSDHGFHTWRKSFNTNTWLAGNGYLSVRGDDSNGEGEKGKTLTRGGSFFPNVDWSRTRAYSLGLGHIYINLKGREREGIVRAGEDYRQLVKEIREKVLEYRDPDTGEQVLENAYFKEDIYSGDQIEYAGDIQLTFRPGYRTSWETALGAIPEHILVANLKKWSGDHCASDVSNTSGFLLSNRKLQESNPTILDVAPTLYHLFGVPVPEEVDGRAWTW